MLDRLRDSFARLSQFSADIAHELRTPIQNLRGEIEVTLAQARSADEYRETLSSSLEECDRLSPVDRQPPVPRPRRASGNPGARRAARSSRPKLARVAAFYEAQADEHGVRPLRRLSGGAAGNRRSHSPPARGRQSRRECDPVHAEGRLGRGLPLERRTARYASPSRTRATAFLPAASAHLRQALPRKFVANGEWSGLLWARAIDREDDRQASPRMGEWMPRAKSRAELG